MTELSVALGELVRPVDGFEIEYVTADGVKTRGDLAAAWAAPFEQGGPVRHLRPYKGQRHLPGEWWSATDGHLVGFESWLERDHLMLLDFAPAVVGIASQPFWLFWVSAEGKRRSHAPDYFTRRRDGSGVVIDCRPAEFRKPRDVVAFEAARRACDAVGWEYRLVGAPDELSVRNVRWISGYRHPRYHDAEVATRLREVFSSGGPLLAGVEKVGDPISMLPRVFHLLWSQELTVDLSTPLHMAAVVSLPDVA
ncbi:TnsA-like heteromeric transposase endonuclease subunit [Actinomadura sp. BRA 177]|uniref:TnsA-like heteromeric transposase endonuclease subunit n=1 Tax=Actinomadura sp. BRA 177 TaxID=2745202 RepID=UPI002814F20B|nr:TnsA-like heteromeric transposase endonuclease subunit [Actinomadura sp. BRA 177]